MVLRIYNNNKIIILIKLRVYTCLLQYHEKCNNSYQYLHPISFMYFFYVYTEIIYESMYNTL